MAKDYKASDAAVNAEAVAFATAMANGYLRIYSGTKPSTADTAITDQVLLAELRYGSPAYGSPTAGVITANAITGEDSALADGTASFYRDFQSDGTTPMGDGTIGASDSEGGADLVLNSVSITTGTPVSVTSKTHTIPKASA